MKEEEKNEKKPQLGVAEDIIIRNCLIYGRKFRLELEIEPKDGGEVVIEAVKAERI